MFKSTSSMGWPKVKWIKGACLFLNPQVLYEAKGREHGCNIKINITSLGHAVARYRSDAGQAQQVPEKKNKLTI
jgi:hypothetical protein